MLKLKFPKALLVFGTVAYASVLLAQQEPAQQPSNLIVEAENQLANQSDLTDEEKSVLEKEKAKKEAERVAQEQLKKEELAKQKAQQKGREKNKVFIPTEEISEDQPVAFPIDI